MCVLLGFTVLSVVSGADLKCSYSADFGADARVEWKFQDMKGSQTYVIFDGKPTGEWIYLGSSLSQKTTLQDFKGIVLKLGFMIVSCILNICSTLPHHQTVFSNVRLKVFSLSLNVPYPGVPYLPLLLLWAFEYI